MSDAFFRHLVDRAYDAFVVVDSGGVVRYWNHAAERIFQYPARQTLGHQLIDQIVAKEDRPRATEVLEQWQGESEPPADWQPLEFEACRADGQRFWVDFRIGRIHYQGQTLLVAIVRDIDQAKKETQNLTRDATTDYLSGLSNRRQFQRVLEAQIDHDLILAIIDLDDFKSINDQFGHLIGDQAIRVIGQRLKAHFPDALCVARLGGEEFGVLLDPVGDSPVDGFERFRESLADESLNGLPVQITVSIGVATSSPDAHHPRTLLSRADQALYQAKSGGRNRTIEFRPS